MPEPKHEFQVMCSRGCSAMVTFHCCGPFEGLDMDGDVEHVCKSGGL